MNTTLFSALTGLLRQRPRAAARVSGDESHPELRGLVRFYQTRFGVLVAAEVTGLPTAAQPCRSPIFGFHIHSGGACTGHGRDPFADALTHYDPHGCRHPYHAGDMPPLFGADGRAFSVFLTDRFTVEEIIGKTVIIHSAADDFTTQPGGNAGTKIACGQITGM